MTFTMRRAFTATLAVLALTPAAVHAQTPPWPTKPLRLLVGFAAGGSSDVMARAIAERLAKNLGQQVIVENRAGAGGMLATDAVAKSPADGYTLLFGTVGPFAISPALGVKQPFDPIKDFTPVGLVGNLPLAVAVPSSLPVRDLGELLALARAKPGQLNYAHTGIGSTTHVGMEILKKAASVDIVAVPYKGQAAAMPDVMSGRVQIVLDGWSTTIPHVKSGSLRFVAVTTSARSAVQPQVPTVAESGFPGFDVSPWYGIWAPAGTPKDVIARLSTELVGITQSQVIKDRFAELGMDPLTADSEKFSKFVQSEQARWAKAIKDANIKVD